MIKSPLRYPGGKSRAINLISTLIPIYDEFREPFVGGGSLFVYLKQKFPNRKYWINDLHFSLYKFWEKCQTNVDDIIDQIIKWKNEFETGKELYRFLIDIMKILIASKKQVHFLSLIALHFQGQVKVEDIQKHLIREDLQIPA
jgi:DNA adenine methylase